MSLIRADENVRGAAVRNAIDAVYFERDHGGTMHSAGEAAAAAVLATVVEALRAEGRQIHDPNAPGAVGYRRAASLIEDGVVTL